MKDFTLKENRSERAKQVEILVPALAQKDIRYKLLAPYRICRRKLMNTECDCFIQTPKRLIIIECKDKMNLGSEQRNRHTKLIRSLRILLPRSEEPLYIELSNKKRKGTDWTWEDIEKLKK